MLTIWRDDTGIKGNWNQRDIEKSQENKIVGLSEGEL